MPDVLVADSLSRSFASGEERVLAVRDASLTVGAGELVVLLGRSGAGKSTLLTMCGGLAQPDTGSVVVAAQDVGRLRGRAQAAFLQRTIGWVFQSAGLLPLLTARENVELALYILGVGDEKARTRASAALAAVGLEDRAAHRGVELSGGEQQRVALARALVKAPALLLADEPTAQLDTDTAAGVVVLIREAANAGTAVLLATHDLALVASADRVLVIEDGVVREQARSAAG
jgi:putative ABC transport system ATP-binding protein